MIDIETMGTGNNPVMIQIAGIFFDRNTGEMGKEFCANISEESCKEHGFVTTQSTIDWWATQDQAILEAIRTDARDVLFVMHDFFDFYKSQKNVKIWSHATFDFVIVQTYLQQLKQSYMQHKNARDIRTLVDLSGIDLKTYDWNQKTHNALDDCRFQIKYCVDALNKINPPKNESYALYKDGIIRNDISIIQMPLSELQLFHKNAIGIPQVYSLDDNREIHTWPTPTEGWAIQKVQTEKED